MTGPYTYARALLLLSLPLAGCSSSAVGGTDAAGGTGMITDQEPGVSERVVTLTELYRPAIAVPFHATDLAFNSAVAGELWVTLRQFPSGLPCTSTDDSGCGALPGVVAILSDATSDAPAAVIKEDGNSWHFMRRPTAIAWTDTELFATCGEARTDNLENEATPYAGPVLWSSDPSIFGVKPVGMQNGTHLDMLHETPYCMGIAFESGTVFWAMNGDAGSLDRYNFNAPHEVGGENHADGEVFRYAAGELLRVPEIPSHVVFDPAEGVVYVADTGHARVVSVDPKTATRGGEIMTYEALRDSGEMVGATVTELGEAGTFEQPSGVALADDKLFVTDTASSLIYVLSTAGELLEKLDTQLPAGSLGGITMGPDGKLYFADLLTGAVRRVEPE